MRKIALLNIVLSLSVRGVTYPDDEALVEGLPGALLYDGRQLAQLSAVVQRFQKVVPRQVCRACNNNGI